MIEKIPEYGWFLLITALRNVEVSQPEHWLRWLREVVKPVEAQAFDARRVAGRHHLYFAALFALKAFDESSNISNSIVMETLLQASAQRQVSKAIEMLGVKQGKRDVAVLLISKDEGELQAADSRLRGAFGSSVAEDLLEINGLKLNNLKDLYGITDRELGAERDAHDTVAALTNLIIERMTLQALR